MTNDLYPFQRAVEHTVRTGYSVILQAPTGSGKTLAALRPFLREIQPDRDHPSPPERFPRKCIYSVPMRVLANQFEREYSREIQLPGYARDIPVSIQTGERPDDPRLEAALIFATIDQTLSSFLHVPYGLPQRQANLNAGAIISSYLVFDEVHLFSPDDMLPTTLVMLRMLRGITPFILMTATFSQRMLVELADWLGAVVIPDDNLPADDDASRQKMSALPSQQNKERIFHAHDTELTAEAVLTHQGRRTLCICNTVARAQALYQSLKDALSGTDTGLTLLHSRFHRRDRQAKEQDIHAIFHDSSYEYAGPPHVLIATQVVEVGLDITSDVLHTELAPAATLLQRAGRCARREGERGQVHIYLPRYQEGEQAGEPDYAPYYLTPHRGQSPMTRGLRLCEATWEALQSGEFTGRHMDFELEQSLIDQVHRPVDEEVLEDIRSNEAGWMGDMLETIATADYARAPKLIRNTGDTRYVFIHPAPDRDEELSRSTPWHYEGFNLRPGTLWRAWQDLLGEEMGDTGIGEIAWRPVPISESEGDLEQEAQKTRYTWEALREPGDLRCGALALALSPEFARYDDEIGLTFELRQGASEQSPARPRKERPPQYTYRRETYTEHIARMMVAYEKPTPLYEHNHTPLARPLRDEMAYVQQRLEECWGLPPGALDRMARLIIALHDLGKLSGDWQAWAHAWHDALAQSGLGEPLTPDYMAAHTDFDGSDEQRELQKTVKPSRPRHAGESAIAGAKAIWSISENCEMLSRAAVTAVMRHHAVLLGDYTSYRISKAAQRAAQEAMDIAGLGEWWAEENFAWANDTGGGLQRGAARFSSQFYGEALLYALLVRILRLADQRSQQSELGTLNG